MSILDIETSPVLETKRIALRQVSLDDAQEVFFLRSNKEVGKYIARAPQQTIEEAVSFIIERQKDLKLHKTSYWGITLKENDVVIGTICLWNFSKNNTIAEVGYDLHPDFQKQGIMTEALGLVLNFGFKKLRLQQIEAFTQKKNQGSITLLQKNKFKQHPTRIDDGFPENIIFELKQKDYNNLLE
jgi:ribosomal-protein-alanine N-acetyltransferase